jgi:hypothetical protein
MLFVTLVVLMWAIGETILFNQVILVVPEFRLCYRMVKKNPILKLWFLV